MTANQPNVILNLCATVISGAPPVPEMKAGSNPGNWEQELYAALEHDVARPISDPIRRMISDRLHSGLEPILLWLHDNPSINDADAERLSDFAAELGKKQSLAGFVLSVSATLVWIDRAGPKLYQLQYPGIPYEGWPKLARNLAFALWNVGALTEALQIIDHAHEFISSAHYRSVDDHRESLKALSSMAAAINRELANACADLADDLLEHSKPGSSNVRAELAALLWSLGFAAESLTIQATPWSPTRRLLRQVIRQSIAAVMHDSLVQYVWLELKNTTSSFNLRKHKAIFSLLNRRYPEPSAHNVFPESPVRTYSRTLIGFIRGTLTEADTLGYHQLCRMLLVMPSPPPDRVRYFLLLGLVQMNKVGQEVFGHDLALVLSSAAENIKYRMLQPQIPPFHGAMNLPATVRSDMISDSGGGERLLDDLQQFELHASAPSYYWRAVISPRPDGETRSKIPELLKRRERITECLRGAYFQALVPVLPLIYIRSFNEQHAGQSHSLSAENRISPYPIGEFEDAVRLIQAQKGLGTFQELMRHLEAVDKQIAEISPEYAFRCSLNPASIASICNTIGPPSDH